MRLHALTATLLAVGVTAGVVLLAVQNTPPAVQQPGQPPQAPPEVLAEFERRLNEYLDVHRKAEASLPALPDEATPEQITQNQRKLGELIRQQRPHAMPGTVFTPAMERHIRHVIQLAFGGPTGAKRRASIMDENPETIIVAVNDRYPAAVPLSTMPPDILAALPSLEEDLEFRFVGDELVLIDTHADLIVDIIQDVIQDVLPQKADAG